MKPLLTRIDEELATCADPYRRAELLGERGCYLVRVGAFDGARRSLALMRETPEVATNERVAVWVMLLEGLLHFFENLDIRCRDRVMRAHAISHASGQSDLARLSAAWMAHIDFNLDRYADVARMLRYSLRHPASESDAASIRAHLVFANLLMLGGRVDKAKHLYETVRRGAVLVGDDSTIAATFYNRINMLLNLVRIEGVQGLESGPSQRFLELEVRSVSLYHQGSGNTSLQQLLDLLGAMTSLRAGSFRDAAERYRGVLSAGVRLNVDSDNAVPALELAICLLSMGELEQAEMVLEGLSGLRTAHRSFDDQLIIDGLRQRLISDFGISVGNDLPPLRIEEAIGRYRERLADLGRLLDEISREVASSAASDD